MPLVPCEACRRHVRAGDVDCPFCRTTRTTSRLVAITAVSALALAGCEAVSPAAKYGGPPANYVPERPPPVAVADDDAGASPSQTPGQPTDLQPRPTATTTATGPRLPRY